MKTSLASQAPAAVADPRMGSCDRPERLPVDREALDPSAGLVEVPRDDDAAIAADDGHVRQDVVSLREHFPPSPALRGRVGDLEQAIPRSPLVRREVEGVVQRDRFVEGLDAAREGLPRGCGSRQVAQPRSRSSANPCGRERRAIVRSAREGPPGRRSCRAPRRRRADHATSRRRWCAGRRGRSISRRREVRRPARGSACRRSPCRPGATRRSHAGCAGWCRVGPHRSLPPGREACSPRSPPRSGPTRRAIRRPRRSTSRWPWSRPAIAAPDRPGRGRFRPHRPERRARPVPDCPPVARGSNAAPLSRGPGDRGADVPDGEQVFHACAQRGLPGDAGKPCSRRRGLRLVPHAYLRRLAIFEPSVRVGYGDTVKHLNEVVLTCPHEETH